MLSLPARKRERSMSWRLVAETGLNLSHKLMLLVFVAAPVKLILGRDEVTLVDDSALSARTSRHLVRYQRMECR